MPSESVSINIEDLQEIMDGLPDAPAGSEKRRNVLTKEDVLVIARVVQAVSHNSCAMGFTPEEISRVKGFLRLVNGSILAIGYAILAAFGAGIVSVSIWAAKHGIAEIASKGAAK